MSLICEEHRDTPRDHLLKVTDEVFCVTTAGSPQFTAVCREVIAAIPANLRSKAQLRGGIDIHFGHSTPNDLPTRQQYLSLFNFSLGERRFSITRETAMRYLPRTLRMY